jgi:IS30 family transposase
MHSELRTLLAAGWSPQQIAGRWGREGRGESLRWSHERIYQLIAADRKAGGTLWQLLRRGGKKVRRDRCGTRRGHRLKVAPEQEIAQRPAAVNDRLEVGHWEVDLVIGAAQQGVLLVAVERVTLLVRLRSLPSKEADVVAASLREMLRRERVFSLTYDRGLEWMRHREVAGHFGAQSWFCRPYHSWQKGSVENLNGQLRFYFPKHEPFPHEEMEEQWVEEVEAALNGRPRRILGYRTPQEAMRTLLPPTKQPSPRQVA